MSALNESSDRLRGAWAAVRSGWDEAKEHWRDATAEDFERNLWNIWEEQVPQVIMRLDELDEVLQQAIERTA